MSSIIDGPLDGDTPAISPSLETPEDNPSIATALRPTIVRYHALGWLTAASALAYLCRNSIGVAESTIRDQLGLTLEQSGWFMGAFFWSYAILQVPSGWFAERFGTRISMSAFAIGWSVATFGIGIAPGFLLLIVAQLLMGAAQAGILPASCNSIGHWMPVAQRTFSVGLLSAGMQLGAITASGLAGVLIAQFGWRWVFIAFAFPGILWAIGFYLRFRDQPTQILAPDSDELALIRADRNSKELKAQIKDNESEELLAIARSPIMWWLCGQQVCRAAGYMFFASWLPTFLQVTCGISVEYSGYLQGILLLAMLPGNILGGMLTDWIWRLTGNLRVSRSVVASLSLSICAIFILGSWFAHSTVLTVGLLAVGIFFSALAGPCAFAVTIDIGGPRVPQVVAVMNMSGNFAAAGCPVLAGRLFRLTENWNLILLMFAGIYLAGAICWIFVDPKRRVQ